MMHKLWNDDAGIVALEYLLVATIVGLGLVVGLSAVSEAINVELTELANAILAIDQSYSYAGLSAATQAGSSLGGRAGSKGTDVSEKDTFTLTQPAGSSIDLNP
jgi:Flp pilus assembly pilin Flp